MAGPKIRIKLRAYDHRMLDVAARDIVEHVTRTGAKAVGPVPLPTERAIYTVSRAPRGRVEHVTRAGAKVLGPVPLPTERSIYTVIRSPHKYKDSREHFQMLTHKRLIDIVAAPSKTAPEP